MASILSFPDSTSPPIPTSLSAEDPALNRPRPGPHLVNPVINPDTRPSDGKEFRDFSDSGKTVAHLDLELARRSNRSRLRQIFRPSSPPDNWPQSAA